MEEKIYLKIYVLCLCFVKGKIDLEELAGAFKDLGIPLEKAEAKKLLQRYNSQLS